MCKVLTLEKLKTELLPLDSIYNWVVLRVLSKSALSQRVSAWKHTMGLVVATHFARNLTWCCVMTHGKRPIDGPNGQTWRKVLLSVKKPQTQFFLYRIGHSYTHAWEALVTPSESEHFERRLTKLYFLRKKCLISKVTTVGKQEFGLIDSTTLLRNVFKAHEFSSWECAVMNF